MEPVPFFTLRKAWLLETAFMIFFICSGSELFLKGPLLSAHFCIIYFFSNSTNLKERNANNCEIMSLFRFAFANLLKSLDLPWVTLFSCCFLRSHFLSYFFSCCFCLKRPSLICLFHFTKRLYRSKFYLLFVALSLCLSHYLSVCLYLSLSISLCLFLSLNFYYG